MVQVTFISWPTYITRWSKIERCESQLWFIIHGLTPLPSTYKSIYGLCLNFNPALMNMFTMNNIVAKVYCWSNWWRSLFSLTCWIVVWRYWLCIVGVYLYWINKDCVLQDIHAGAVPFNNVHIQLKTFVHAKTSLLPQRKPGRCVCKTLWQGI